MEWILQLPVLFFSVIFHEFAHGFAAYRRGDDTAYLSGRLSFNPLPHIDPVGTLLLPAACALMHFRMIGWAKPVPVNPYRLRRPRADMAMVALSGPLSNIFLAIVAAIAFRILSFGFIGADLQVTAVFNMIPVFPLDGSQVALGFLKGRALEIYEKHIPYGTYIIIGLVFSGLLQSLMRPLLNLSLLVMSPIMGPL